MFNFNYSLNLIMNPGAVEKVYLNHRGGRPLRNCPMAILGRSQTVALEYHKAHKGKTLIIISLWPLCIFFVISVVNGF